MSSKVRIKDAVLGHGVHAKKGDRVVVDVTGYLPRGEMVLSESGLEFVLGSRRMMAGLEYGVEGMQVGGEREINVPPHLAYGDAGTANIPPKAALKLKVILLNILERE